MTEIVLRVAAVVANVAGASMSLPQAARVLRTGEVAGVSLGWVGVSVAFNAWWIAWGVSTGTWVVVPVSVAAAASYMVLAVGLVSRAPAGSDRMATSGARIASAAVIGAAPPAIALLSAGWAGVGLLLGTLYGAQMAPAAAEAYRRHDLSGVSPVTWMLAFVEALMWLVLGVAGRNGGLMIAGVGGLAVAGLILGRIGWLAAPTTTGHRRASPRRATARAHCRTGGLPVHRRLRLTCNRAAVDSDEILVGSVDLRSPNPSLPTAQDTR